MIAKIDNIRREATKKLDQSKRSQLGQFMTPGTVAQFMASIFQKEHTGPFHLLDAGAGIGSLTASFLERKLQGWGTSKSINISAYEIDRTLLQYLKDNIETYKALAKEKKITVTADCINRDFIKDAVTKVLADQERTITHAILNPPYKKIHSSSDYRKLLSLAKFETVNLYSAFVGMALHLLKDKGELVAIIPRSFCNGNYYIGFRNLITEMAAIKRIHLFDSRSKAFKEDDVLQENIIIHLIRGAKQGKVLITRSTDESLHDLIESSYPFKQIIKPNDTERFIHIPHNGENHLEDSDEIKYSLEDLSIQVSTGPVVDFRAKKYLFQEPQNGTIPLLYPSHFNGKEIEWPKAGKKPNAIALTDETMKMFFPNGFYTVVRRFSSKEEKQRIVARVINPNKLETDFIGIENHLNVFHFKKKGISEDMAYGLAAYLNSTYVDTHFRSFNGHTQVNATDLKQMQYPSSTRLKNLGKWAKGLQYFDQSKIDKQIKKIL